jgi:ASPIC/UnbV protein/VCBS repeat protein
MLAVLLIATSCSTPLKTTDPAAGAVQNNLKKRGASHASYLKHVREVADQTLADPTYGFPKVAPTVVIPPESAPANERWAALCQQAFYDLSYGKTREGVEHYLAAYQLLPQLQGPKVKEQRLKTTYDLAIAYMRLGETENCIARHTAQSCLIPIKEGGVHTIKEPVNNAVRYFTELLDQGPENLQARWLLNVAYMTAGKYPQDVPKKYLLPPNLFESDEPFPQFTDIAPQLGLNNPDLYGGAIAEDFDNDGLIDLMTSTASLLPETGVHFYHNNGDGTFEDRTEKANLTGVLGGLNMVQADYNNDGYVDVLILRGAWWGSNHRIPHSLLENRGDGTFVDVTTEAGLAGATYPTQTAAWADYDNDGDLDVYFGAETGQLTMTWEGPSYNPMKNQYPGQLFRNNGDGTFTEVTKEAGLENLRWAKGVVWGDYDNDRWPDLFVSNFAGENRLYHNKGDGTFEDVAKQTGVNQPIYSFPAWFWDFDNDGNLDLYLPPVSPFFARTLLGLPTPGSPRLWRGDGKGGFTDVTVEQKLTLQTSTMGSNYGDLDNDGYLDMYLGTGGPPLDWLWPNLMYHNRGGKGFSNVTWAAGVGHLQKGHGVVFADFNNDGNQDLFEQLGGMIPSDGFGDVFFRNPGFNNNWIKIRLVGVTSNRSAIGARIHLTITENGATRSIYRTVSSGGSFGANPLLQEIGLGKAARVDQLEIFWPRTGKTQTFHDIAAGQLIEIREDATQYQVRPLKTFSYR